MSVHGLSGDCVMRNMRFKIVSAAKKRMFALLLTFTFLLMFWVFGFAFRLQWVFLLEASCPPGDLCLRFSNLFNCLTDFVLEMLTVLNTWINWLNIFPSSVVGYLMDHNLRACLVTFLPNVVLIVLGIFEIISYSFSFQIQILVGLNNLWSSWYTFHISFQVI